MADRSGLKFVGFIFATITLAVMLTTAMVVNTYADGGYTLESATFVRRVIADSVTIEAETAPPRFAKSEIYDSAAPDQRHRDHRKRSAVRQTGS